MLRPFRRGVQVGDALRDLAVRRHGQAEVVLQDVREALIRGEARALERGHQTRSYGGIQVVQQRVVHDVMVPDDSRSLFPSGGHGAVARV